MSITVVDTRFLREGLYARVRLGGDALDCTLGASAATSDGNELPVRVLRGDDEGEWTLALPALATTQVVKLQALSWDGAVTEEETQRFGALTSRMSSLGRTIRRSDKLADLHVPSARDALGEWEVGIDRLVRTSDGSDLCQGRAVLTGAGAQSVEGPLDVRILDSHGHDATLGAWTCLSDQMGELADHPGFYCRRVEFSLRVKADARVLVVWVQPGDATDSSDPLPCGFACLPARTVQGLRDLWRETATEAYDDEAYDAWYRSEHAATTAELSMQLDGSFEHGATFSLVSILRHSTAEQLREMVDSVLEQSYGHLELVLVNAAPTDQRLASAVRGLELADARIRCVPLAADFGSAKAAESGIDAATGDFVCLLGEGDLLAPDALWCLSRALDALPDADVLYTDEDCVERDRYVHPRFKPEWDPDLLLGTHYTGSLTAIRANLLSEMEPLGTDLDEAQAHYLTLYATARARRVVHVPRVLYHVRGLHERPRGSSELAAGLAAVRRHLAEEEQAATARASACVQHGYELSYPLPEEHPLVSVVIVNCDAVASLDRCLASLRDHAGYDPYEVVIVEQGSVEPETFEYYRQAEAQDPRVRTIFSQEYGRPHRARLVNYGVSRAQGAYILLLSTDVEAQEDGWMSRLVSLCAREGTGAAAARLVRTDSTIASTGLALCAQGPVALDRYRVAADRASSDAALLHAVTMASGDCLMVDALQYARVQGMKEWFAGSLCDEDLCLRLWGAGQRVVVDPQTTLVLHRPLEADEMEPSRAETLASVGRLWAHWPFGSLAADPSLGPNVDPASPYHSLPR